MNEWENERTIEKKVVWTLYNICTLGKTGGREREKNKNNDDDDDADRRSVDIERERENDREKIVINFSSSFSYFLVCWTFSSSKFF